MHDSVFAHHRPQTGSLTRLTGTPRRLYTRRAKKLPAPYLGSLPDVEQVAAQYLVLGRLAPAAVPRGSLHGDDEARAAPVVARPDDLAGGGRFFGFLGLEDKSKMSKQGGWLHVALFGGF